MIQNLPEYPVIILRREAVHEGLPHYFTGKPCAQGHIDFRTTADRKCCGCNNARSRRWRKQNPDTLRSINQRNYAANKEQRKADQRAWNATNATYAAEYAAAFRRANPDIARLWRQANPHKIRLYQATRRAAILQRTPSWADMDAIRSFYLACPEGYHVDHIIPLRGKIVSGLHVCNNLQYLTSKDNLKKLNKFDPNAHIILT